LSKNFASSSVKYQKVRSSIPLATFPIYYLYITEFEFCWRREANGWLYDDLLWFIIINK